MQIWNIIWQSVLLAIAGLIILRLAGRKSVSQMTVPQIATIITIGAILGSDVGSKGVGFSILAAGIFVGSLIIVEWISLHWNRGEKLLKGKSLLVIDNGELMLDNLKRTRITVDDLEKRLRVGGVTRISDVKAATIEDNGQLGIELTREAQPVTVGDLERVLSYYFNQNRTAPDAGAKESNLFNEVIENKNAEPVPKNLQ